MSDLPPTRVPHPHVERLLYSGSPVVRGAHGLRVPVIRIWGWHKKGVTVETLVRRYPSLGWAAVLDALSFAYDNEELIEADLARERALVGP